MRQSVVTVLGALLATSGLLFAGTPPPGFVESALVSNSSAFG